MDIVQAATPKRRKSGQADASDAPSKADILEDILVGLRQAKRGEGMDARQMIDEIRAELKADADES